jgi:DNA polymerase I-like protein with 3'-5' exonuclease and polymerase domains
MERAHPLSVPLVVDTRTGPNWLEMDGPDGRSKD